MPAASSPSFVEPALRAKLHGLRANPGEVTRERLLEVGLQLFAEQGFPKTSVRQIAQAAGANVAAISYHFGNKAGLYRAVYFCGAEPKTVTIAEASIDLASIFGHILAPLRSGGQARAWVRLQCREMLEPTGLWQEKVDRGIRPLHGALVALLCERVGLAEPDDGLQALATLVLAPAVHLLLSCELIDLIAPRLLGNDDAIDAWCTRLLRHAELLIVDERRSRAGAGAPDDARALATSELFLRSTE